MCKHSFTLWPQRIALAKHLPSACFNLVLVSHHCRISRCMCTYTHPYRYTRMHSRPGCEFRSVIPPPSTHQYIDLYSSIHIYLSTCLIYLSIYLLSTCLLIHVLNSLSQTRAALCGHLHAACSQDRHFLEIVQSLLPLLNGLTVCRHADNYTGV